MNKAQIRRLIINKRDALSDVEISDKSAIISKNTLDYIKGLGAKGIYAYANAKSEVITKYLIEDLLALGIRVALPRVDDMANCSMNFYEIHDYHTDIKKGAYDILEPKASAIADFYPDIIIMPGLAFDKAKNRIGYGKGYYDRFLEKFERDKIIKLGIAFELQIVDRINTEETDKKLDIIITEENIYE